MRYHEITAEYRLTTIRMRGKQLLGTALGQNNLPVGDLRLTMTNGTGRIRTDTQVPAPTLLERAMERRGALPLVDTSILARF